MPVPKRKRSHARRSSRFAQNEKVTPRAVTACQTCQAPIATHSACLSCGYYKGVKVVATKSDRMDGRVQQREAKNMKSQSKRSVVQVEPENNEEKE